MDCCTRFNAVPTQAKKNAFEAEIEDEPEHGTPNEGAMCLCTMEDITEEDGNYVEYQVYPSLKWKPALFESSVVEQLLGEQFEQFIKRVEETDCEAELRRLLEKGPPVYISDKHGLPLNEDDGDKYIIKLWFATGGEKSAKLKGGKEGEERQKLWDELNKFISEDSKEENVDDVGNNTES